jgi:beta-mannosidase
VDALTTDRLPDEGDSHPAPFARTAEAAGMTISLSMTMAVAASKAQSQEPQDLWPQPLDTGWQCVSTPAGACASPADLPAQGWLGAQVPGTVASARRAAGLLDTANPPPLAFDDHWYRLTLTGTGKRRLRLHGLATRTISTSNCTAARPSRCAFAR